MPGKSDPPSSTVQRAIPDPQAAALVPDALSFDFEDWGEDGRESHRDVARLHARELASQVDAVLAMLAEHNVKATFFTVGCLSQVISGVIRTIADQGHEVGVHSYFHHRLEVPLRARFHEDLRRAKDELEAITGNSVVGFRAPAFSIPPGLCQEFLDILADTGFRYDSSVVPVACRRYGIEGFGRHPCEVKTSNGQSIMEFPLSVVNWLGKPRMIAGGGYWRLLPAWILLRGASRIHAEGRPFVTYLHTYDFEVRPLRKDTGPRTWSERKWEIRMNLGRRSVPRKLDCLLGRLTFAPFRQLVDIYQSSKGLMKGIGDGGS